MCFATTDEIGSVTDMTTTKNEIMSKNGNLMGFATTDEIGSVTDMTKTKNEIGPRGRGTSAGRPGPRMMGRRRIFTLVATKAGHVPSAPRDYEPWGQCMGLLAQVLPDNLGQRG